MLKEFREFAVKGNVVDMAVGIIIGSAFTAIVKSLVDDVIMPPIGWMTGGVDFSSLAIALPLQAAADGEPVAVRYGVFINALLQFVIVAFVVFLLVRAVNRLRRDEPEPAPADAPTCPFCRLAVDAAATRCPHCTSQLAAPA
jgi:large conductance mechanosensitive channel